MQKRWDIFCAVIDNYGDAGVCWRLARQLVAEFELNVRLWIDDVAVLQRLYPEMSADVDEQIAAGVCVLRWLPQMPEVEPADVVIEAFACRLPEVYISAMARQARAPLWINLEYLSAESWVGDCHALPSPQPNGLTKYFFFPGFDARTGGLLKECNLIQRRRAFQRDSAAQSAFLARFGVERAVDGILMSLFAYEQAPVAALFEALSNHSVPVVCVIPEGKAMSAAAAFFGEASWPVGACRQRGALTAVSVPFMSQDDFDRLLWCCDVNCVRGEDSFLRAQWAGRPLLWHIYPQQQGAHWPKLDAFLRLYCDHLPPAVAEELAQAWRAWNGDGDMRAAAKGFLSGLPALRAHAENWAHRNDARPNLAATLVQFCADHV